jgi:hypothetical protein
MTLQESTLSYIKHRSKNLSWDLCGSIYANKVYANGRSWLLGLLQWLPTWSDTHPTLYFVNNFAWYMFFCFFNFRCEEQINLKQNLNLKWNFFFRRLPRGWIIFTEVNCHKRSFHFEGELSSSKSMPFFLKKKQTKNIMFSVKWPKKEKQYLGKYSVG